MYKVYTRELDGVPVIKYLSYIHLANGLYYNNLAYPKEICSMTSLFQNVLYSSVIYNCVTVNYDSYIYYYVNS